MNMERFQKLESKRTEPITFSPTSRYWLGFEVPGLGQSGFYCQKPDSDYYRPVVVDLDYSRWLVCPSRDHSPQTNRLKSNNGSGDERGQRDVLPRSSKSMLPYKYTVLLSS